MNFESYSHVPGFIANSNQLDRITGMSDDFNRKIQLLTQPAIPSTLWSQNLLQESMPKISSIATVPSIVNSLNLNSLGVNTSTIQNIFPSTLGNTFRSSFIDSIAQQSSLVLKFNELAQESFQSYFTKINGWSGTISNTLSNQIFTFDDFRKNVLVHETFNELEDYKNSEVLSEDIIYLQSKVFNLEEKNNHLENENEILKNKLDIQQFETDIDSMRIDDLEHSAKVSAIVTRFFFTIQFFVGDITYETLKELLSILVLQIKYIVDKY